MAVFERAEYAARIAKTKAAMALRGIDVLIASDPANMNWLVGYDGWSFYTPQCVVVALERAEPVCIVRGMDANGAKVTTILSHDDIVGYPDHYVQTPERHPFDYVALELIRRGLGKGRIGVEMDANFYTAACHAALQKGLPSAQLVDANLLVNWQRAVKSPAELKLMRQAAVIMEQVMRTALEAVRPGVRQCDAVAAIYAAQMRGTAEFGGDYTAFVPMLPTGVGTSTPHLTWTDQPFVTGEATILELAAARHRYHCPMARTMYLGDPPQKFTDTAKVVMEGMDAALAAVRPGVTCESVEAAWRRVIARHGLEKTSRIGYSVGLNYPPDWGEHTMSLRPGDLTPMEVDMTFHMILGMWMDDWGIEISETFRVAERGAECLCSLPRDLVVIG